MPWHGSFELALMFPQILLPPQVPHDSFPFEAKVGPFGGHGSRLFATIEQTDRFRPVFHVPGPDFQVALDGHAAARFAQRVLVHVDDLVVGEQA